MKIKPVEIAAAPKYPDKYSEEVQRVLMSAIPNRWRSTSLAAIGLSAIVVLSLSGCTLEYTTDGVPIQSPTAPIVMPSESDNILPWGNLCRFQPCRMVR